MTKYGETNNFTVSDFTNEIEKYLGSRVDYVVYNNFIPNKKRVESFKKKQPELLDLVKFDEKLTCQKKFIGADLLSPSGPIEHDPKKLAKILIKLCRR